MVNEITMLKPTQRQVLLGLRIAAGSDNPTAVVFPSKSLAWAVGKGGRADASLRRHINQMLESGWLTQYIQQNVRLYALTDKAVNELDAMSLDIRWDSINCTGTGK